MSKSKKEQLQDVQFDSFIGSLFRTASGGHRTHNKRSKAYAAKRKALENRLKQELSSK